MHLLSTRPGGHVEDDGNGIVRVEQTPGDIVVLTVADTTLSLLAEVASNLPADFPSVRLANLMWLRQPASTDLYMDDVLRHAKAMFARDELRPAIRHLKQGGVLWFAPDQETRRGDSVFVPFFGQPAWSLTSTHQLARLSGAAVLPLFHERLPDGRYRIEVLPPLEGFPTRDATADTARIMATLEGLIRRRPGQYLWLHQRFKRQPDGTRRKY